MCANFILFDSHSQLCIFHLFGLIKTLQFDNTFWVFTLLEMFKDFFKNCYISLSLLEILCEVDHIIGLNEFENF